MANEDDGEEEEKAGPSNAQQVTVKFKHQGESKTSQELTYQELQLQRNQEAWIDLKWHTEGSSASDVSIFFFLITVDLTFFTG